ncbi:MinD-like ATPase involved in chromosome partitioning or flagellar assembly [Kribbella sp. VKM Ac-2527]|uniref:MinD-like ATPase involved in chromosome partitioning or flagellar assembly n=1 Tax=Kribbella caucasensis TaxID=2512215 RepID=A0A4V3C6Z6_9ACTN|nr:AAA family ATPase [Kribbella sp. VKM Ac-2527]TDO35708.1 MinD-like ATPase involved in chromosome partitioning or flagellar assembly [Kribbella sp. VKM Ac-2527]
MPDGRIITVFAAKGGCGKTTVATNLAVALAARGTRRVCLVDLDLRCGDVAEALGLRPRYTLRNAVGWAGELTAGRVALLMTKFRPGLDCLLAPTAPGDGERISGALVSELLSQLPAAYDFVVVDTPARFDGVVLAALDAADHHVLVTTPDRPALKSLRRTLDVLDLLMYDPDARSVLVNRSANGLPAADLDQLIRSPITWQLPSRDDVPASINRGEPLALTQPDHPVSQAVRRLADALLPSDGRCSRDPPPG